MSSPVSPLPTRGFARGVIVRRKRTLTSWPNMMVVRGLGKTTAVLTVEGDEGGTVRLREVPTDELEQVVGND